MKNESNRAEFTGAVTDHLFLEIRNWMERNNLTDEDVAFDYPRDEKNPDIFHVVVEVKNPKKKIA